ncbi:MAG: peptide MFS transporter, partial [Solimonas sp.]
IAMGHFTMALPYTLTFYTGMLIIVLGTGLFKPTMSSLVGLLYRNDSSARRDAGFSIFYMGINLGSFIGQIVCGYLGERMGWHYGFAAAGVFMLLGLTQFKLTIRHLHGAGATLVAGNTERDQAIRQRAIWVVSSLLTVIAITVIMTNNGWIHIDAVQIATCSSYAISALILGYFIYVLIMGGLLAAERKQVIIIMIMVLTSAFFWSGFEQAGSSFNLFAQRYTDRLISGWEMPASWLQSVNSFFIITLAPVFAALWLRLGATRLDPSMPVKFGLGLIQLGLGFLVLFFAARFVVQGMKVSPVWLVITYLFHSTGELCLSPVGLSAVTKLAPARYAAQMMGAWFMANALGNVISGLIAGHLGSDALNEMPYRFLMVFAGTAGVGLLLLLVAKWINTLDSSDHSVQ